MSVSGRWDMAEQLLREAEEALGRPPRDAGTGHARVRGAQAELAWLRQQQQGAVEALEEIVDDLSVPHSPAAWAAHALQTATAALESLRDQS